MRQPGAYHIHDQGEMCFERSTVSHEYSVKRCENIGYIYYMVSINFTIGYVVCVRRPV